ncbi:MAG: oligosaccharide flippase family protein, partial [Deltaproteobacteria bacterium]|nr:oligosaccharide flippase family protein [Deltaproteobacteria bacterium]
MSDAPGIPSPPELPPSPEEAAAEARAAAKRLDTKINRGVAWTAASQAIVAVADLVSQLIVVSWFLSYKQFGIAMMAIPLYSILDTLSDFGVTSALIQRDDHTPERISTVFWFNVMLSSGLFLLLLVLGPLYGHMMGYDIVGSLLIAYGAKLLLQNFYAIPYALMRKDLQFAPIAKIRTFAYLGESVSRIVFAYFGITIWCFTLAALVKALVFAVLMQIRHPFIPKLVFRFREVAPYIKFGLRSAASQMLYYTYTNIDYTIVAYYFGATANGIYALAYWIVLEAVKTIANVVIEIAFPTFARLRGDREGLIKQFIRLTRLNLIAVLPFVVLILLIIPELLNLFYTGGSWSPAELEVCGQAARILCMVGLLRALGLLGPSLLDGVGRPELTLRYMIACAILVPAAFILGANVLGDELGMLSIAVAWTVGYPLAFGVLLFLVCST